MDNTSTEPDYHTHEEAAAILRRTPACLRQMNYRRQGPPRTRVAGRVLYPRAELLAWLDAQRVA